MTTTRPFPRRLLAAAAILLPLAGCLSFGEELPPTLMTLTAAAPIAAGPAQAVDQNRAVQVSVPSVPQSIATLRVPVQASATGIAYLKDARWAEPPNRLFRNLVAEVVTQRTGRVVLDPRQLTIAPGLRLTGGIKSFGVDATAGNAVIVYDAMLVRGEAAPQLRRFEARVPVAKVDGASVAPALNQAANQVAVEVADWIGG